MSLALITTPPRQFENDQAEQAVLGAILRNNTAFDRIADVLKPEHFGSEVYAEFFRIIRARIQSGRTADPITIRDEAMSNPITGPSWSSHLMGMTGAMVTISGVRDYALAVHDCWVARSLRSFATDLLTGVRDNGSQTAGEILEEAHKGIANISESGDGQKALVLASGAVDALLTATEARWKAGNALSGLDTGFEGLNDKLSGMRNGGVYVVAARPGAGKSALGIGLAVRMCQRNGRGLVWSGEMPAEELMARAIAAKCNLPLNVVLTGMWTFGNGERQRVHQRDMDRIVAAGIEAAKLPLVIDDRESVTVQQIASRARRMKREKAGLSFIVIDYIGLMRSSAEMRRSGNRTAEVTEISGDLARMARELNVPVIVLSQLNRQSENRDDRRPSLADIRDSGAIEQDARCVMAIYREEMALRTRVGPDGFLVRNHGETDSNFSKRSEEHDRALERSKGKGEVIVLKNRGGQTGIVGMHFDGPSTWFRDISEDEKGAAW